MAFTELVRWERSFLKTVLVVALPMILQNLMGSSLHIIDGLMVGQLGTFQVAAVAQAGRIMFLQNLFLFGVGSGTMIFVSQFWGAGEVQAIKPTLTLGLLVSLGVSLFFFTAVTAFTGPVLGLFIREEDAQTLFYAKEYLRGIAPAYLIMGANTLFSSTIKAVKRSLLTMIASIASIALNTVLNYILIFGAFGAPKWGVYGAGVASSIACASELALLLLFSYGFKLPTALRLKEIRLPGLPFLRRYIKVAAPVMFNEGLWALGVTTYSMIYGRLGSDVVAAYSIFGNIEQLAGTLNYGIMSATAVIVGNILGSGDEAGAYLASKRMLFLSVVLAFSSGLVAVLLRVPITMMFNVEDSVRTIAQQLVLAFLLATSFKAFNATCVVGILRSGGDTVYSMLLDLLAMWLVSVPLALIGAFVFRLSAPFLFLLLSMDEFLKVFVGSRRFRSRKWIHRLTAHTP